MSFAFGDYTITGRDEADLLPGSRIAVLLQCGIITDGRTVMAYDEMLAERIGTVMGDLPGLSVKKMFGGVGYIVNGNMACGVNKGSLIVRVGPERYAEALARPFVSEFDMTGRPMRGWVSVSPEGYGSQEELFRWVGLGVSFARTLRPK